MTETLHIKSKWYQSSFSIKHSNITKYFSIMLQVSIWLFSFWCAWLLVLRESGNKSDLMGYHFQPRGNKNSNIWQGVWMFLISTSYKIEMTCSAIECHCVCITDALTLSLSGWPLYPNNKNRKHLHRISQTDFSLEILFDLISKDVPGTVKTRASSLMMGCSTWYPDNMRSVIIED